jgi:hypothetical protein
VLYDCLEGAEVPDLEDRETLLAGLKVAYGDASWVDLDRIAAECIDPATDPADARRFYLNQLVAWEEDAVELALWDALGVPGASIAGGESITLGFDGADSGDACALVAVSADRVAHVLGLWERPEGVTKAAWQVPRLEVLAAVESAFERFRVVRMYCDPPYWQSDIDGWRAKYGDVVARYPTFSDTKMAEASARFDAVLRAGELTHAVDDRLRRHIAAARRTPCRAGWRPAKKDARKIDLLIGLMLALQAHGDATAAGEMNAAPIEALAFVL